MDRKAIDIEALLRWAYRDELPKALPVEGPMAGIRSASLSLSRAAELMAVVQETDVRNRFGLFPDRFADSEPHADAVRVHEAVTGLDRCAVDLPEGWDPLSDMGDLGPEGAGAVARGLDMLFSVDASGARILRRPVARLVIRQAILGGAPAWEGEMPERRKVTGANGKVRWFRRILCVSEGAFGVVTEEVEVDGIDPKRRLPHPDAYTRTVLDPDPAPVVQGRAEYELWRAALDLLTEDLAGRLETRFAMASDRSRRPWEAPDAARRILPSLIVLPVRGPPRAAA